MKISSQKDGHRGTDAHVLELADFSLRCGKKYGI